MKNKIIIFLAFLTLTNCKYFRGDHCNNTMPIVGVYENVYDKEATNYLIINKNGTFEQVFTKDQIIQKNKGTWKYFKKHCDIDFENFKLMHEIGIYEKKLFRQNGRYRLNKIMFIEDLGKEFDFYRVKD